MAPVLGSSQALPLATEYPRQNLERLDVIFSFQINSDPPLRRLSHVVEVSSVLDTPAGKQTFPLLPAQPYQRGFNVTVPLDTVRLYAVLRDAEQEAEVPPSTQLLTVTAKVLITGESDAGPFAENFTQDQILRLTPSEFQWVNNQPKTRSDSIIKEVEIPNPDAAGRRVLSISGVFFMAVVFGLVFWNYLQSGTALPTPLEMEAIDARQRHGELLVDVDTVPAVSGNGTVVHFGSLEELFKAADALMKPVLHRAGPDQHVYYVLDGATLYRYLNQEGDVEETSGLPSVSAPGDDGVAEAIEPVSPNSNSPVDTETIFDRARRMSGHPAVSNPNMETNRDESLGPEQTESETRHPPA